MRHAAEQARPPVWHEALALAGTVDGLELGVAAHEGEVFPPFHHEGVYPVVQQIWAKQFEDRDTHIHRREDSTGSMREGTATLRRGT